MRAPPCRRGCRLAARSSAEDERGRGCEKFLHNIQTSPGAGIAKIGLVLINVNITDITDESGYIEAIGRKAASQAVQQALIDVALQVKHGQTGVAEADREKSIQVAKCDQAARDRHARRPAGTGRPAGPARQGTKSRDTDRRPRTRGDDQGIATAASVRIAELDREQKVGEQSAVLEREARIKDAERKMRIATADANAKAISGEATAQAEIAEAQANLQSSRPNRISSAKRASAKPRPPSWSRKTGDGQGGTGAGRARGS